MEDTRVFLDHSNATPSYIPVTPQMPVPALVQRSVKREHVQVDEEPTVQILLKRPKVEDEDEQVSVLPTLPPEVFEARDPIAAVRAAGGQIVRRRRRRVPGTRVGVETVDIMIPSAVRYHPSISLPSGRLRRLPRRRRARRRRRPRATAAYRSSAEAVAERHRRRHMGRIVPTVRYHPSIQAHSAPASVLAPDTKSSHLTSVRYHPSIH